MITDEQSLVGAKSQFSNPIRFWDDGFGSLWVYRETMGVVGIVRATTWEEAYQCVVDEIMCDADPDDPENWPAGDESDEDRPEGEPPTDGDYPEGIHVRGSGVPSNDGLDSPLAAEDLNGIALEPLTPELLSKLKITLEIENA